MILIGLDETNEGETNHRQDQARGSLPTPQNGAEVSIRLDGPAESVGGEVVGWLALGLMAAGAVVVVVLVLDAIRKFRRPAYPVRDAPWHTERRSRPTTESAAP